ncbi:MAG TPA: hypothetical protein VGG85_02560 [Terracidiphilus sp.]|jgi:hypothetical protein
MAAHAVSLDLELLQAPQRDALTVLLRKLGHGAAQPENEKAGVERSTKRKETNDVRKRKVYENVNPLNQKHGAGS